MALYKNNNNTPELIAGGTNYAECPIGTILPFGGSVAPAGWFLCQGQAISRTIYSDLYSVIGTSYGVGDGSTTFNLPDAREVALVGAGTNTLNASSITNHNAINLGAFQDDQLQEHNHYRFSNTNGGSYSGAGGTGFWTPTSTSNDYGQVTGNIYTGRKGTTTHGKQLGVNYIIKAKLIGVPTDFIETRDKCETVITVTQMNVAKSIDISSYSFLVISVIINSGIRVGTITIPTSFLSSTRVFEIGMYESSSINTACSIYISSTEIRVPNHITTGWTFSGVEVLGIK